MSLKILTDSSADVFGGSKSGLDVDVLPMNLLFDEEEYTDGVDLSVEEFYEKLRRSSNLPKTSQVNAYSFKEYFEKEMDLGNEVVAILISSKLSGTYNSAMIAKKELGERAEGKIFIVDSETVTTPLFALIVEADKLKKAGKSAKDVCDEVERLKKKVRIYAVINDLTFLRDNGRLSNSAAYLGSLLRIKPVITIENGEVVAIHKAIGSGQARQKVKHYVREKGIDLNYPTYVGHTDDLDFAAELKKSLERHMDIGNPSFRLIGCTVAVHAGFGSAGLIFFEK